MIPKVTIPDCVPLTITPQLQAQILHCVASDISKYLNVTHECSIHITPNNIILEHDNNKIAVTCLPEWIQVMYVLNNLSLNTKTSILQLLKIVPTKLLMMIDVIMLIQHIDIRLILLRTIFDQMQYGHTYNIHTFVNNNNTLELLLCYSKCSGYEHNPYNLSKRLINYVDNTYNIYEKEIEDTKAAEICGPKWVIDSEQQLYLTAILNVHKMISVAQIKGSKISSFIYIINNVSSTSELENKIDEISRFDTIHTQFHDYVTNELNIDIIDVQIHHKIVNGELC